MKKGIRSKNKVCGTKYFVAASCVAALALIGRIRKENITDMHQVVPTVPGYSSDRKRYASVEIMQGDTLWSIAENNKSGNYTTKALVEEIKSANGLTGDKIIAGNYLIVPYYD